MSRFILVTGSSRGLGASLVRHFLDRGDTVIGCARSEASFSQPNYLHHAIDIADDEAVKAMFFSVRKQVPHLDAVINNAGIARMNAFALTPPQSLRDILAVNVLGTFSCSQRAIGLLRKSPAPRIVNFTTVAVPLQLDGEAAYAASKSAVETLTRIMARELAPFNITCNAIGPSPIQTDLIKGVGEEKIARLVARQAIHRMATPEDVINVVDFFLSPGSGMVTGQIVYLGGIS
ncbi:MAG: SDR family oxidoreductase [Thermodesulfobacteriota bacterium]